MPPCPECQTSAANGLARCARCRTPLLAPALGPPPRPSEQDTTLAPSIYAGPRLGPEVDLAALLRQAREGDELELGPGTFVLRESVILRQGVTLNGSGRERTRIVGTAAGFLLQVNVATHFIARGIGFEHQGPVGADVLWIVGGHIEVVDCHFRGAAHGSPWPGPTPGAPPGRPGGRGLWVAGDANGVLRRCEFAQNALDGLEVGGQAALLIDACTARANRGGGVVARERAYVTLAQSRLMVNFENGLAFFDDAAGLAHGNTCERNGASGIAVFGRSAPRIENNTLRANQRSGLAFWQQAAGFASGNLIDANQGRDIEILDAARPTLHAPLALGEGG